MEYMRRVNSTLDLRHQLIFIDEDTYNDKDRIALYYF